MKCELVNFFFLFNFQKMSSFYFREKPRVSDKLRGKTGDEILQEIKQHFDEDTNSFFEPSNMRMSRDPFERHTNFPRVSFYILLFFPILHNNYHLTI